MIEWPKKKWQSHLELFFWTKEKETRVKIYPGLNNGNRPSDNPGLFIVFLTVFN